MKPSQQQVIAVAKPSWQLSAVTGHRGSRALAVAIVITSTRGIKKPSRQQSPHVSKALVAAEPSRQQSPHVSKALAASRSYRGSRAITAAIRSNEPSWQPSQQRAIPEASFAYPFGGDCNRRQHGLVKRVRHSPCEHVVPCPFLQSTQY
jgi:hypothetical protein